MENTVEDKKISPPVKKCFKQRYFQQHFLLYIYSAESLISYILLIKLVIKSIMFKHVLKNNSFH